MTTNSDDKNNPVCTFHGGTLGGKKHRRMMFGFVVGFIMEPVYAHDRKNDASLKDITHRQIYERAPQLDADGNLAYALKNVEVVSR